MTEILQKALNTIIQVADPDKVILFGSRARNEENPDSDYDLLVLKSGVKHTRKLSQKIRRLFFNAGAPFDIIVYDSKKYDEVKDFQYMVYYDISREGVILYEKG